MSEPPNGEKVPPTRVPAPTLRDIEPTLPDMAQAVPDTAPPAADATPPAVPDAAPQAADAPPAAPEKPAKKPLIPPQHRRRVIAGAVGGGVLILALAGYFLAVPLMIKWSARKIGISLRFDGHSLHGDHVRLTGVRASLVGVDGLEVRVDQLRVGRDGTIAKSFEARGVVIDVEGSAAARLVEISTWSSENPGFYAIPGTASEMRALWRDREGRAPWLTVAGGSLSSSGQGAKIRAASASVGGVSVGAIGASWAVDASKIALHFGAESPAEAPIAVEIRTSQRPPTASVTLRPVKLDALGSALGIAMPLPGAVASGAATMTLGGAGKEIDGSFQLTLRGWLPPHPKELNRIIYGKETLVGSRFAVSRDYARVTLTDTQVTAGAFKLKGGGTVDREGDHAVGRVDLKGQIPCAEVARSAASSSWGDALGALAGEVAKRAVEGSLAVGVRIEADSRDLGAAKVKQDVGVGCGLKF